MQSDDQTIATYDQNAAKFAAQYEGLSAEATWGQLRSLLPTSSGRLAIDIGAGSGRDAAWLAAQGFEVVAAEPAAGMRLEGERRHPELRWIDDRLPSLSSVHQLGLSFDLVLLNAVWMHVRPTERPRAFRKMITLVKPGGVIFLTLRQGPSEPGRAMFPVSLGEIEALSRDHGLAIVRVVDLADALGRDTVKWTIVCLRVPDDGAVGLPLIRGVILNDDKASTYKLGLLRALAKAAESTPSMADPSLDDDSVAIPLGLIALNWVRMYLPLVASGMPQAPNNSGPDGLGFAKSGFRSLSELGILAQELRPGASFSKDRLTAIVAALTEARNTIVNMPVRYITLPNSGRQLFHASARTRTRPSGSTLTADLLRDWGSLSVPGNLWRTMLRLGAWIEPLLLSEWARLTRNYAARMGLGIGPGEVEGRLVWTEPIRSTLEGRQAASRLHAAGTPIRCVWSSVRLEQTNLDIDHALPWSAWPCGDLWNLLPASRRINQHLKRERLPTEAALEKAREPITEWWAKAWNADAALAMRFETEAKAALPIQGAVTLDSVFSGLEWRRLRLQQDQQPPEWAGV